MSAAEKPDYGEPWTYSEGAESDEEGWWHRYAMITNRYEHVMCKERQLDDNLVDEWNRIVSCINACAGMDDPAKEIAAMREAIKAAHLELSYAKGRHHGVTLNHVGYALAALEPFIKP